MQHRRPQHKASRPGRDACADHDRGPKRSLSQNFLTAPGVVEALAEAGELSPDDAVLEIGPGQGVLTRAFLARGARVVAIEKDDGLAAELHEVFSDELTTGQLTLIHDDALSVDPPVVGLTCGSYKLLANIPYHITGLLLRHFLAGACQPERMVLLVQKEIAERILARDGKESVLSLSVKAFGVPRLVRRVAAGSFHPRPKVDSAILAIEDISRKRFRSREHEERFFTLVRAGFAQKRKRLAGNLAGVLDEPAARLAACGVDTNARAEELALDAWLCLADEVGPLPTPK
ncbi:ribosomal RNA small subunit methyltransferase A [Patescibacteria group bacterium]|nr:ribosomal RNA small subunit methyltransferase A [Patescibacteria group bacterium]